MEPDDGTGQVDDEPVTGGVESEPSPQSGDSGQTPEPSARESFSAEIEQSSLGGAAAAPATQPAGVASLVERLRSSGIPVQADSDDQAIQQLANNYKQLQAAASLGYQARTHLQELQQQAQYAQQQAAKQQAAPAPKPSKYDKLEYDPEWESMLKQDDDGNLVPRSPYIDPSVATKYQSYVKSQKQRLMELAQDPAGFMREALGDYLQETIGNTIQERLGEDRRIQVEQQFASQAINNYQPYLFATDTNGNYVTDQNGSRVLSAQGHIYANAVAEAVQSGIQDTQAQHYIALGRIAEAQLSQPRAQPQPVANVAAQPDKRKQFLDRVNPAIRTPNRNGTVYSSERDSEPQNISADWQQVLEQAAAEAGITR